MRNKQLKNIEYMENLITDIEGYVVPTPKFEITKNNDEISNYSWKILIKTNFRITNDERYVIKDVDGVAEELHLDGGYRMNIKTAELFDVDVVITNLKITLREILEKRKLPKKERKRVIIDTNKLEKHL